MEFSLKCFQMFEYSFLFLDDVRLKVFHLLAFLLQLLFQSLNLLIFSLWPCRLVLCIGVDLFFDCFLFRGKTIIFVVVMLRVGVFGLSFGVVVDPQGYIFLALSIVKGIVIDPSSGLFLFFHSRYKLNPSSKV